MKKIQKLVLAAMFLAIGHVLPFFTGQIPQIGRMLLPMHIPVLLCGLVCGWQYGLMVGFVLPIMRSAIYGMPFMFPDAVSMAFELATYGSVVGYLFNRARWQCVVSLYRCMLMAMVCGRVVWGIVRMACMGLGADAFTIKAFFAGAFINAVPGIILQLIVVPAIMLALDKTHLVPFRKHSKKELGYVTK
jgi:thiamine transporter ThiT